MVVNRPTTRASFNGAIEKPVMGAAGSQSQRPPVALMTSPKVQTGSAKLCSLGQRGGYRVVTSFDPAVQANAIAQVHTVYASDDNKFAALNTAVWSGGSFIYVPPGVRIDMPLQAYFRINAKNVGQFERTLIIVDEGAQVHRDVEGLLQVLVEPVPERTDLAALQIEE